MDHFPKVRLTLGGGGARNVGRSSDAPYVVRGWKLSGEGGGVESAPLGKKTKQKTSAALFSWCHPPPPETQDESETTRRVFPTPRKKTCYVHAMTSSAASFPLTGCTVAWVWWKVGSIEEGQEDLPCGGTFHSFHFLFVIFFLVFFRRCCVTLAWSPLVRPSSRGASSPLPADSESDTGLPAWLLPFPVNHLTANTVVALTGTRGSHFI